GKVRMPLYSQYGLQTGKGQKASVKFHDGSVLHINQRSDIQLRSAHLTRDKRGEVVQVVEPGTHHSVQTAAAVATAQGTIFDVRVLGMKTIVLVKEGAVLVHNKKGSVLVKTGQESTVQE